MHDQALEMQALEMQGDSGDEVRYASVSMRGDRSVWWKESHEREKVQDKRKESGNCLI